MYKTILLNYNNQLDTLMSDKSKFTKELYKKKLITLKTKYTDLILNI